MRKSVNDARRGITWDLNVVLEDLDFADDGYFNTVTKICKIKLII